MRRQNRPGFLSVGDVLRRLSNELGIEEKREEFEALRDWAGIVGARIAKHTVPLYIRSKVLYIQADGASWGQEIAYKKTTIIEKLNSRFGRPKVDDVRCRVGPREPQKPRIR